jgi:hypothetical protein
MANMKKVLGILSLIALLAVAAPIQAADDCLFAGHTIGDLRNCVLHAAEMGHIDNQGVLQGLLSKLDAADSAYNAGQTAEAVEYLEAFIHQVEAQAGKHIDADHAAHMIHHAENVIAAVGG